MSDATIREMPESEQKKPGSQLALRLFLLVVTTLQTAFVVFLTAFIIRAVGHYGNGKEHVAISIAIMLLEVPFTIPAFVLALRGKALGIATWLAGFATFACVIFWIQVSAELMAKAPS